MALVEINSEGEEILKLRRDSTYVTTPVLRDGDDNLHFDLWEPPIEYSPQRGDRIHTVTSADAGRPDIIAYQYYQNVRLYWVILYANKILNPFNEVAPGVKLIIPASNYIRNYSSGAQL